MPRRKSKRLMRYLDSSGREDETDPLFLAKYIDDETEEEKPSPKEKQTNFSMAVPAVTPDSKRQRSKKSKPAPLENLKERIHAGYSFGEYPKWGETPEELSASINFETPEGQDSYGNILEQTKNKDKKMAARVPIKDKTLVDTDPLPNEENEKASKHISVLLPAEQPTESIHDSVSDIDSMEEYRFALARPRRSLLKNTGYVYYEHLHGGLVLFRVQDSESGRDAYIEQAIHGLEKPEFQGFVTYYGWLSAHANTDTRLPSNKEPYFSRGIILLKGSFKKEAAQTTTRFFKALTKFLNGWMYMNRRLTKIKEEGSHWYHYLASEGIVDRTSKDKRKLCDVMSIHDTLAIVKSIATNTLGYSSDNYWQDKKFTNMYFNPPYTPEMMAELRLGTFED